MNYSERVNETVEFADLRNKVQALLDFLGTETSELEDDREFAMQSNQPVYHQAVNNNIKQNYIISSTLQAIRTDIENMHDDIQMDIKKEKSASDECLATESDNA